MAGSLLGTIFEAFKTTLNIFSKCFKKEFGKKSEKLKGKVEG